MNEKVIWHESLCFSGAGMTLIFIKASAQATNDAELPNMLAMNSAPTVVNVSNSAQYVTFTAVLTDNLSGVQHASFYLTSPSGQTTLTPSVYNLISSSVLSGTFQGVLEMPQYSKAGDWLIHNVYMYDRLNNAGHLDEAQLRAMSIPITLTVITQYAVFLSIVLR